MKGLSKVEKIVNEFLEPFGLTGVLDTDFYYLYEEDEVHYAFATPERSFLAFLENAEKRFPQVHADIFLWSLLHEIGHSETGDDLTEDEEEYSMKEKDRIFQGAVPEDEQDELYFSLPDEYAATDWAGHYMMEHAEEVKEFWVKFQSAYQRFLTLNKVTR